MIEDKPLIAAHLGLIEEEKGDVTTVSSANGNVITMTEQPKPKFTLQDLDQKLTEAYEYSKRICHGYASVNATSLNSLVQEMLAIVSKHINDLEPIDVAVLDAGAITTALETEKICFHVTGVQLMENGQNKGTSLYSTVFKARKIRDILNAKFAELRVNHEAKLINYPVY